MAQTVKNPSAGNVGDLGSILGLGRCPGTGNGNPLQYSGLESSMDYSPRGHKESDTTERLSLSVPTYSALPEDENCFHYSNGLELQN